MVSAYNDVTGTKRRDNDMTPTVWVPFVWVLGVPVRAVAAVWNSAKGMYWVHFNDHERAWVDPSELAWQRELVFPDRHQT